MPNERIFRVGTRGSRLALAQTQLVVDALPAAHPGTQFEMREITTQGDRSTKPLSEIGGQGVFTKAIEDALLRDEIDIAVHSMKDLPPRLTPGLTIAAVPKRGDPRDALVTRDGRKLDDLPPGARIGTGSARRAVQLKAMRPDVECVDIRGNVDTRIRKVDDGEYDAIVVAMAGLARLGLVARAAEIFSFADMVPSPGQGALAVQVRSNDSDARNAVATLNDVQTQSAVSAERKFLERLGAGCQMPVGAIANHEHPDGLSLRGFIVDSRGKLHYHHSIVNQQRPPQNYFGELIQRLLIPRKPDKVARNNLQWAGTAGADLARNLQWKVKDADKKAAKETVRQR